MYVGMYVYVGLYVLCRPYMYVYIYVCYIMYVYCMSCRPMYRPIHVFTIDIHSMTVGPILYVGLCLCYLHIRMLYVGIDLETCDVGLAIQPGMLRGTVKTG